MAGAAEELWRYRGLVANLAQRELKLRYKRSVLGWLWSLLNPAAILLTYTLVFGIFLRLQPPPAGNERLDSFSLYLFAGLVIWNFFSAVVVGAMGWLLDAGPLLKKVYFPAESAILGGAFAALTQTATEAFILVAILAALGNVAITGLLFPYLLALLVLFTIGLSFLVSLANVYFRDVTHMMAVAITLLFYATPIVYPVRLVPEQIWGWFPARSVIHANPLTQFVDATRAVLYELRWPTFGTVATLTVISVATFAAGWFVFKRLGADLSEEL